MGRDNDIELALTIFPADALHVHAAPILIDSSEGHFIPASRQNK